MSTDSFSQGAPGQDKLGDVVIGISIFNRHFPA
jgi:hypothetical protein